MAVVVDPKDAEAFLGYAAEENLEAVIVAVVTENPRLKLSWRGKTIVDISQRIPGHQRRSSGGVCSTAHPGEGRVIHL